MVKIRNFGGIWCAILVKMLSEMLIDQNLLARFHEITPDEDHERLKRKKRGVGR